MSELDKYLPHEERDYWTKGLSPIAKNIMRRVGVKSKQEIQEFLDGGGSLRRLKGVGAIIEKEILDWMKNEKEQT